MEIIETGALRRVDAERTEDVAVVQLFEGIYGVGMFVVDLTISPLRSFALTRTINRIRMVSCGLSHS